MNMTDEEIIEMAKEASGEFYVTSGNQTPTWYFPHSTIYDFADLVAAKEREDAEERVLQLIKELRPAIKPLEGMGKGKTTDEWFDILVKDIKEKL